jgi:polysaccharide export outer membrane protein
MSPFKRRVVVGSDLRGAARLVDEHSFIDLRPPASGAAPTYKIGVGDTLQFARLMPQINSAGAATDEYTVRSLPVTSEGYISIVEVGRVDVVGKTISEAEAAISAALLRSGVDPRFEVSVQGFNSQKIFYGGVTKPSSIPLTTAGVTLEPGADKVVKIFRGSEEYRLSARDILTSPQQPVYYLQGGDRVYLENMYYRPETVVLTGEVGSQSMYAISAEARQTLSDALFSRAALALFTSDSSQIYLIRRNGGSAVAYHLDGSNPVRLSIASEIELRPQDVIFVAEQPVTRYNRVMQQLLGALSLSQDLRDSVQEEL